MAGGWKRKSYIIITTLYAMKKIVFLLLSNIKGLFKRIQLFSPRWKGRKEVKRTSVLEEGREGSKGSKGSSADHPLGRDVMEAREGGVLFQVQEDGKSWIWENMLLRQEGASSYRLYIRGTKEGWEEEDTINCYIPNVLTQSYFLDLILQGKPYYFSSIAEPKPLC